MDIGKIVFGPTPQVGRLEPRQRDERTLDEALKGVVFTPKTPPEDWKSRAERAEATLRAVAEAIDPPVEKDGVFSGSLADAVNAVQDENARLREERDDYRLAARAEAQEADRLRGENARLRALLEWCQGKMGSVATDDELAERMVGL